MAECGARSIAVTKCARVLSEALLTAHRQNVPCRIRNSATRDFRMCPQGGCALSTWLRVQGAASDVILQYDAMVATQQLALRHPHHGARAPAHHIASCRILRANLVSRMRIPRWRCYVRSRLTSLGAPLRVSDPRDSAPMSENSTALPGRVPIADTQCSSFGPMRGHRRASYPKEYRRLTKGVAYASLRVRNRLGFARSTA